MPDWVFVALLFAPMALSWSSQETIAEPSNEAWKYSTWLPFPLDAVLALVVYGLTGDVFVATATAVLFVPLYRSSATLNAWPWAAGGVMLGLGLAWSQTLTLWVAGFILLMFVLPWLIAPQQEQEDGFHFTRKKNQQTMALWASVLLVSLYLVLTWVLLLASIDAVNFEAHELYGAPFLAGLAAAFFTYTRRKDDPKTTALLLGGAALLSAIGFIVAPTSFGRDASTMVSEHLTRGHIVWISLPMVLLATAPMVREVAEQVQRARKKGTLRRIPVGAHVVHLGVLLLILGHLSTTVLVDRGDATHRISLVKDEVIVHEGFGFEFDELILESEDLEVGDGFIGCLLYTSDAADE